MKNQKNSQNKRKAKSHPNAMFIHQKSNICFVSITQKTKRKKNYTVPVFIEPIELTLVCAFDGCTGMRNPFEALSFITIEIS